MYAANIAPPWRDCGLLRGKAGLLPAIKRRDRMINRKIVLGVLGAAVVLGGCGRSDEYAPAAEADGAAMFQAACVGCHEPVGEGVYFELSADKAKPGVIAEKITKGSMAMPGFPNITGDKLETLSQYVVSVSKVN